MKKITNILSIIITAALCMGIITTAFASGQTAILNKSEMKSLCEVLQGVESQKVQLGLASTDFNNLRLGKAIQTYIYINDTFELGQVMYPILDDNKLILLAIEIEGKFQITTALVNEINGCVDGDTPFTIVYDQNSSYLYANGTFTLLKTSSVVDISRSVLNDSPVSTYITLSTTTLSENVNLEYSTSVARASAISKCDVNFVTQNPPSNMCWAATIACIVNYKKGYSLTAASVAQGYYGFYDYNKGLARDVAPTVLSLYGLSFTYKNQIPADNVILRNIVNDYPLYTSWDVDNGGGHAVCVYGINPVAGYLCVMDPECGFLTAALSGGKYKYKSGYSGVMLTLASASCYSW